MDLDPGEIRLAEPTAHGVRLTRVELDEHGAAGREDFAHSCSDRAQHVGAVRPREQGGCRLVTQLRREPRRVALCEQIRVCDRSRLIQRIGSLPQHVMDQVVQALHAILDLP